MGPGVAGRGERAYDIYSRLLRERIVCVMGPVGGSVTSGLAIYDTMQYVLTPVCTWCVGQAASMGSLLLAAGAPGLRHALPNARIMVHQPSGGARAEEILQLKRQINGLYAKHTGQPLPVIVRDPQNPSDPLDLPPEGLPDPTPPCPPRSRHGAGPVPEPGGGAGIRAPGPGAGASPSARRGRARLVQKEPPNSPSGTPQVPSAS
ncbi:hypothetical protein DUI87_29753 [Hirundo rustica rustica]|uniref:ATP-dependent Clp protease proteolytic subunit n=1 Tax=Hirundo rustica rustica TaxID=333673 RepID=A0A3M0IWW6_HIRRU|nr:hypothetical protein DUI87_29753 [Hirundo rustica rustica]